MTSPTEVLAFWDRKTFCLVTGASQGIGREIAVMFAPRLAAGSLIALLARSQAGLDETEALILNANPKVTVKTFAVDLSNADAEKFSEVLEKSWSPLGMSPADFELAMIVHNAGTTGDVSEKANEMLSTTKWADYLSLNLVSMISLNSTFLKYFPVESSQEKCIVNVTSLCGIKPFKSMGYYCVGKAAREMYVRVLAEEFPKLNILSYSPGPVDTEMQVNVAKDVSDPEVKEMFTSIRTSGKILTTEQTTKRCMQILTERKYKSGDHIDYFDTEY